MKITFSPCPLKKFTPPFLLTPPPPPPPKKNSKSASPPLLANIQNFLGPPCRKGGGGDTVVIMDTCIREVAGNYARCRHTKKQKQRQRTCNSMIRMKEITRKSIRKKPKPVKFWTSSPKWKNKNNTFLLKIPNLHQKHHNQFSKRMLNVCWYWQESTYHQERIIIFLD